MIGTLEKNLREAFEQCDFRKNEDENPKQQPNSTRYKFRSIAKDIIASNYDYYKGDIEKYENKLRLQNAKLSFEEMQRIAFEQCINKEVRKLANRFGDYSMNKTYKSKNGEQIKYEQSKTTLDEFEMYCEYLEMTPDEILYKENDNIHEHIYNAKDFMSKVRVTELKKKEIYMPIISDMITGITMYSYINLKADNNLDYKLETNSGIKNSITYFVSSVTYKYRSFDDAYDVFISEYKRQRKILFNGTKKVLEFAADNLSLDDEDEKDESASNRKEPNYFRKMRLFMKISEDIKDDEQLKNSIKALYGDKKYIKDVFYNELDKKLNNLNFYK